ncbi:MAG: hypothetical protein IK097_03140 [Clostridia bacterium]|nr:hypothetical protein [Clostridia bacterium]
MSQPMSKKKSIVLVALAIILLVGICFATLAVYAKKELNKPKFKMPEEDPVASASELPQDKEALCAYVNSLYEKALKADNAEGSWHTDVNLEGYIVTPFAGPDNSIVSYIKDNCAGEISALYPNESEVKMSEAKAAPVIRINPADVADFTAEQGHTDDAGNVTDDGFYFINFEIKPESVDTASLTESKVYTEAVKKLGDVADVVDCEFESEGCSYSFKIDRTTDEILNVDVCNNYRIKANTQLKSDFTALLPLEQNSLVANIELPYKTARRISFKWYGARFYQRAMAVKPDDMKSLPADVKVNTAATKDDYNLTFTPSKEGVVSIDADGVMTVSKHAIEALVAPDDPITIEMKLDYEGKTYTDDLKVYITELEVETDV